MEVDLTNQTMSLLSGRTACPFILSIIPKTYSKKGLIRGESSGPPYPHGHADCTVHVAFVQPPMLGDPTLLRAKGGSILGEKKNTTVNLPLIPLVLAVSLAIRKSYVRCQFALCPFTGVII